MKLSTLYRIILLSILIGPVYSEEVDLNDISVMTDYTFLYRSKNYNDLQKKLRENTEPTYLESFLMGVALQKERKILDSIGWFSRAAFKYKPLPENTSINTLNSYLESGIRRSPFYAESVYEVSRALLQTRGAEPASKILELIPGKISGALEKKVLDLRIEIIGKLSPAMAVEIYKGILREKQSPLLYLKLGGLQYASQNPGEALESYFMAMSFPENDWTYLKASNQVEFLLKQYPFLKGRLTVTRKIQLAEALRIDKRLPESFSAWRNLEPEKMEKNELALYVQNFCRLKINLRQYDSCLVLVKKYIPVLETSAKEQVITDISNRFYNLNLFHLVIALTNPGEFQETSSLRIRSLDKLRSPQRITEAEDYLKRFDHDSVYAEGVYFGVCFEFIESKNYSEALNCLNGLKDLTANVSVGGRSRYFMARIYEKLGDNEKADEYFKQVYLNSPEHFYAFGALSKVKNFDQSDDITVPSLLTDKSYIKSREYLDKLRQWIADNYKNKSAMKNYFLEKKKNEEFGVDPFWKQFEEKLEKTRNSLSENEKKASAFMAMGQNNMAEEYIDEEGKKTNENFLERKLLVFYNAGLTAKDDYLKATYIEALLSYYHKQADIMTMSSMATDSLYPTPFRSIVSTASEKYSIEEAQVYALMKQESGFHPGATSRSGARGLMQIMPATARWLNKTVKIKSLDLYNPAHSIELGASFYAWLNKISEGDFEKMAIAYNAGPGRLKQWIDRYYNNDFEIFLEKIPADETYYYVQKTRKNYDRYKILLLNEYDNN